MDGKTFQCRVITPEAQVFEGPADGVIMPAHDGQIGVLHDRAPLVCRLGAGRLSIRSGAEEHKWFIESGFAQMLENHLVILAQKAKRPEELDRADAMAQLEEARAMSVEDEVAARRKAEAEDSARAQIRMLNQM
jgi:F-type H+-transporting ATPase subunit epsilon